ncbi:helix-turn-helix domain-containing protein [Salinibaculum salinum]|uniref:winged helix-turn-helix transcriptional regulator n=1 Tax=Salinibaculum salinum TaxID=3131996 RepID=UPI0030EC530B
MSNPEHHPRGVIIGSVDTTRLSTEEKRAAVRNNPGACPIVNSVHAVGEQYRPLVIYNLLDGEQRFNDLKRAVGTSSRTLSQALDSLQEKNSVHRRSKPGDHVAVYYRLTEKGQALDSVFEELAAWDERFGDAATETETNAETPATADD